MEQLEGPGTDGPGICFSAPGNWVKATLSINNVPVPPSAALTTARIQAVFDGAVSPGFSAQVGRRGRVWHRGGGGSRVGTPA